MILIRINYNNDNKIITITISKIHLPICTHLMKVILKMCLPICIHLRQESQMGPAIYTHLRHTSKMRLPTWFCTPFTVSFNCLQMAWPRMDSTLKLLVRAGNIRKATTVVSLWFDWYGVRREQIYLTSLEHFISLVSLAKTWQSRRWSDIFSNNMTFRTKICYFWNQFRDLIQLCLATAEQLRKRSDLFGKSQTTYIIIIDLLFCFLFCFVLCCCFCWWFLFVFCCC